MITQYRWRGSVWLATLLIALAATAPAQQPPAAPPDPFRERVPGVTLNDQDVIDGVAMLSRSNALAVSVEYQLGPTISGPAPQPKTLNAIVGPGTVEEILDGLCSLDHTFTWFRNGGMVNVLPRALVNDPAYLLNRKLGELTFQEVRQADDAVIKIVDQLPGTREQIAIMQTGTSVTFARPWSVKLQNVTVREVFDLIAQQLGPTYGWEFGGAQDFRIITFHQGILPNPSRNKQKESQDSRPR